MPTGYTAKISDDISFNEFIIDCARAFGACVTLRDTNDPIPEQFEPSDYHLEKLEKVKTKLQLLNNLSTKEITNLCDEEYTENEKHRKETLDKITELRRKYRKMLESVLLWEPPTVDHNGLKDFMIQQLEDTIKFDCDNMFEYYIKPTEKQTPEYWWKAKINECRKNIKYHEKEYQKEKERTESRSKWIKQLRESLKDDI